MNETAQQNLIRLSISKVLPNVRLFRNQVGKYMLPDGRWISSGLAVGSSDLVGWRTIEITPDMVGKHIAQFVCVEVKTPTGKTGEDQKTWRRIVIAAGGIAVIARSADEVIESLK